MTYPDSSIDTAKISLPTVTLSTKDLPAIKEWQVGKTYQLTLKVKQMAMRQYKDQPTTADFEILKVKSEGRALTKQQEKMMHDMSLDMEK